MSEEAPAVEEIRERYLDAREPGLHEPTPGFVAPTLEELVADRSEDLLLPDEDMGWSGRPQGGARVDTLAARAQPRPRERQVC